MTIIAYKDGIMAADTQVSFGECAVKGVEKIIEIDDWVIGFSGTPALAHYVCDLFFQQELSCITPPSIPKTERMEDGAGIWAIVVHKKHPDVIWRYDRFGYPYEIRNAYMASGAGMDVALGAMFAGASAEEAVRAAITHCQSCGGDVQVVKVA